MSADPVAADVIQKGVETCMVENVDGVVSSVVQSVLPCNGKPPSPSWDLKHWRRRGW